MRLGGIIVLCEKKVIFIIQCLVVKKFYQFVMLSLFNVSVVLFCAGEAENLPIFCDKYCF